MAQSLIGLVCLKCGHHDSADLADLCRIGCLRCDDCGAPMEPVSDDVAEVGVSGMADEQLEGARA